MLNKTINEITPETLVKWYNLTQYNLQTIQNKLKNANDCVWAPISQMVLSDDFIRDFKTKLDWCWISTNSPLNENFIGEFQDEVDWEAVSQFQALSDTVYSTLSRQRGLGIDFNESKPLGKLYSYLFKK